MPRPSDGLAAYPRVMPPPVPYPIRDLVQSWRRAHRTNGRGASPIGPDSCPEGTADAAKHANGIAPERFVHFLFDLASSIFVRYERDDFPVTMGILEMWHGHGHIYACLIGLEDRASADFGIIM
jgi:hypothetical protein